jgi:dephospho-CoA kinase
MKTEFPRQVFEKYSNVKFHEEPYSGSRVVPNGQTDRQTLRNFAKRAYKHERKADLLQTELLIFRSLFIELQSIEAHIK